MELLPAIKGGNGKTDWYTMSSNKGHKIQRLTFTHAKTWKHTINTEIWEPIYRYPVNFQNMCKTEEMTEMVQKVVTIVEELTNQTLNHVVGNLYMDNNDNIPPHQDKDLDIKHGSKIISVSLGEERTMSLIKNNSPETQEQEIKLTNGSIMVIGPNTNNKWKHGIIATQEQRELE